MDSLNQAFHFYRIYKSLQLYYDGKMHFFDKNRLLSKLKFSSFEVSRDRFRFLRLVNIFETDDSFIEYLHFLYIREDKIPYVGHITNELLMTTVFEEFKKNKANIDQLFSNHLENMSMDDLKTDGRKYPKIIQEILIEKKLFIDIFVIYDIVLNLSDRYKIKFSDDLYLQDKLNKYIRYKKLCNFENAAYYKDQIIKKLKKD